MVLSKCLELEAVRYDGSRIPYDLVRELEPWVEWVPVCPEVEIGLGVPREPIRLVRLRRDAPSSGAAETRLLQPATDRDVTEAMRGFAADFLDALGPVDGFLLKNRSPSCGPSDVKVYAASGGSTVGRGPGLFAEAVLARHPGLAVEDEGRLRNFRIREHFLTRLFALARLRAVEASGSMAELSGFQARYKLLLMAYDQEAMRALGRTAANPDGLSFPEVVAEYRGRFSAALERPPRHTRMVNALQHAVGHFKEGLATEEKALFGANLRRYREGRIPVSGVTEILRAWAVRFGSDYLLAQALFMPYPEALRSISDSGRGGAGR